MLLGLLALLSGARAGLYVPPLPPSIYLGQRQDIKGTFLGYDAGLDAQSSALSNIGIGHEALKRITTGVQNISIGERAVVHTTTGASNIGIGKDALGLNIVGNRNVAVGIGAGYQLYTDDNTAIGHSALFNATSGNGKNTAVGKYASVLNTTGDSNVSLGYQAGYSNQTGSGNVFLGYEAGYSETGSNKLYIANTNTTTPLIGGDFGTAVVTITGKLTASAGLGLATATAKPTCQASTRGLMWNTQGGAGVADVLEICQKNSSDSYVWVTK